MLAAPAALAGWQLFELTTRGALPAAMLAGYMHSYNLQSAPNKLRSAVALLVHAGWIVSPLIVFAAFVKSKRLVVAAVAAAAVAALYDPNPLFWISIASGALLIAACFRRGFLESYVLVFFFGSLLIFFAGSARYLLPIAAPVAMLAARYCAPALAITGFAMQLTLALGLAIVNYQHWDGYRQFAVSLARQVAEHRVWVNAEWGLRYYLESEGALPMARDQPVQPGEIVISSTLALPLPVHGPLAPFAQTEIRPVIPLRIISLDRRSAYSVASAHADLPFEISTAPIDHIRADVVIERKPTLTSIDPRDPASAPQIVAGLFPDGWMSDTATVILKRPARGGTLEASFYIPDQAPARHIAIIIDGHTSAETTLPAPGLHKLSTLIPPGSADLTITLTVDKTFSTAADRRKLGAVISRIGF
jgi:hypothetical protein